MKIISLPTERGGTIPLITIEFINTGKIKWKNKPCEEIITLPKCVNKK